MWLPNSNTSIILVYFHAWGRMCLCKAEISTAHSLNDILLMTYSKFDSFTRIKRYKLKFLFDESD